MKIYFAGEPGGNKREREKVVLLLGVRNRLQSFFYLHSLQLTFEVIKDEDIFRNMD